MDAGVIAVKDAVTTQSGIAGIVNTAIHLIDTHHPVSTVLTLVPALHASSTLKSESAASSHWIAHPCACKHKECAAKVESVILQPAFAEVSVCRCSQALIVFRKHLKLVTWEKAPHLRGGTACRCAHLQLPPDP